MFSLSLHGTLYLDTIVRYTVFGVSEGKSYFLASCKCSLNVLTAN